MANHNNSNRKLEDYIKEQRVVFIDQDGIIHKVYNNKDEEFIMREGIYFKNYEYPSMCNPEFPCKSIVENFNSLCKFKIADKRMMEASGAKCKSCLYLNQPDYKKRGEFLTEHALIPDISVSTKDKYLYWIEGVRTHACSDYKFKYIQDKDFSVLEYSISDLDLKNERILPVFNLKTLTNDEYLIVKEYYRIREKNTNSVEIKEWLLKSMFATKRNTIEELNKFIYNFKQGNKITKTVKKEESSITLQNAITYLDKIMEHAAPKLSEGETLCFDSIVKMIIEKYSITEEAAPLLEKQITSRLRKTNYSKLDLRNDCYLDETIVHYGLKRRISIVDKEVSNNILEYNKNAHIENKVD